MNNTMITNLTIYINVADVCNMIQELTYDPVNPRMLRSIRRYKRKSFKRSEYLLEDDDTWEDDDHLLSPSAIRRRENRRRNR